MIAGVDGCRAGWVAVTAEDFAPKARPTYVVVPTFADVLEATSACEAVAVDMPIGLSAGPDMRECDRLAKAALPGSAKSRVFAAPPRAALHEPDYPAFSATVKRITGKGPSKQLWNIMPKIREVDALMTAELQRRVVEAHPELAWARQAGEALPSKHAFEGLRRRIAALPFALPEPAVDAAQWKAVELKMDDVLDACICLSSAAFVAGCADLSAYVERRLPLTFPQLDAKGLRMEIWR